MEGFPSAKEAREKALVETSESLKFFLECIQYSIENAIEEGKKSTVYSLEGENQRMYDRLADYLTNKGYSVYWNGACLWMEISWEDT